MIEVARPLDHLASRRPVARARATPMDVDRRICLETTRQVGIRQRVILHEVPAHEHPRPDRPERPIRAVGIRLLVPPEAVLMLTPDDAGFSGATSRRRI